MTVHPAPFPHAVLDDQFDAGPLFAPPPGWEGWEVEYKDSRQTGKRTTRNLDLLPPAYRSVFANLLTGGRTRAFGAAFDVPNLEPDPTMHGGGLHLMPPGSKLVGHLDYALHPKLPGMERRLNAVAFLNPEWGEDWGGALCFLDGLGRVVERVFPKPGRIVLFETADRSYHGVEEVTGPKNRVTAAVYYVAPARADVTRERAMFFPD